jgi:hypothetical protein
MAIEQQSARSWITDGIIIALIPAVAYFFTFANEAGFCAAFRIPLRFISLNTVSAFLASIPFLVAIASIFLLFVMPAIIGRLDLKIRFRLVCIGAYIIALLFVVLSVTDPDTRTQMTINFSSIKIEFLVFAGVVLVLFVYGVLIGRSQRRAESTPTKEDDLLLLLRSSSAQLIIALVLVIILVPTFFVLGMDRAKQQVWFHVIDRPKAIQEQVVVLQIYGDYIISAPLVSPVKQEGNNQVEGKLYILKLSEMSDTPLTFKKVGPLTVKEQA